MVSTFDQPPPIDLSQGRLFSKRQEALLGDMEEIFLREGYRALTVEQLVGRLHCSRSTLYELAPSKDELVLLVLDRLLQRIGRQAMAQAHQNDDPLLRVYSYMSTASVALSSGSQAFSVDVAAHPGASRLFQQHYRFATSVCARLIQDGIDQGVFRDMDARLAAEVLYASLERITDPDVLRLTEHTGAEAIQQVFDLFVFGLSEGDGRPRSAGR